MIAVKKSIGSIPDALREAAAKTKLKIVDRHIIEHAVRAREVDVLKDTGAGLRAAHAHPTHQLA